MYDEEEAGVFVIDLEVLERVRELEGVEDPDIVRIAFEGRLEIGDGFFDQAEPQLVRAEEPVGSPGERVYPDGLLRHAGRLEVFSALDA